MMKISPRKKEKSMLREWIDGPLDDWALLYVDVFLTVSSQLQSLNKGYYNQLDQYKSIFLVRNPFGYMLLSIVLLIYVDAHWWCFEKHRKVLKHICRHMNREKVPQKPVYNIFFPKKETHKYSKATNLT